MAGCTDIILTDLTAGIDHRLRNKIDLLIFNPPYVPTDEVPLVPGISSAWSGGEEGIAVTSRFIRTIPDLLSETGVFYLLLLQENHPDHMMDLMRSLSLDAAICISRRCGREQLSVVSGRRRRM